VIQKGSFAAGDRCVFFEVGSVLPAGPSWSKFLRKQQYRVTEREVFGVVSQGLVLSVSILDDEVAPPDGDFRHRLGVTEARD
jgi:tRNA-binding EMAP/Myf-like protein